MSTRKKSLDSLNRMNLQQNITAGMYRILKDVKENESTHDEMIQKYIDLQNYLKINEYTSDIVNFFRGSYYTIRTILDFEKLYCFGYEINGKVYLNSDYEKSQEYKKCKGYFTKIIAFMNNTDICKSGMFWVKSKKRFS